MTEVAWCTKVLVDEEEGDGFVKGGWDDRFGRGFCSVFLFFISPLYSCVSMLEGNRRRELVVVFFE